MTWPQIHLALNHFPVIGLMFGILFWIVALARKDRTLQGLALYFFVLVALTTLPLLLSGDPAAKEVKKLPDVSQAFLDAHDEVAEWAIGITCLLGACALGGVIAWRRASQFPRWFLAAVFVLLLVSTASVSYAAYLGGRIHHQELTGPAAPTITDDDR